MGKRNGSGESAANRRNPALFNSRQQSASVTLTLARMNWPPRSRSTAKDSTEATLQPFWCSCLQISDARQGFGDFNPVMRAVGMRPVTAGAYQIGDQYISAADFMMPAPQHILGLTIRDSASGKLERQGVTIQQLERTMPPIRVTNRSGACTKPTRRPLAMALLRLDTMMV